MFNLPKSIIWTAIIFTLLSIGVLYSLQKPSETKTKDVLQVDKNTHTETTITTTKEPGGKTVIVKKVIEDKTSVKTDIKKETQIAYKAPKTRLFLITSTHIQHPLSPPAYGIGVSREIIGPVTLGVFALTDGTIGITAGIDF